MNKAIELSVRTSKTGAIQKHYKLDPPVKARGYDEGDATMVYRFVVVSAVDVLGDDETYIFPADEDGEITDWMELEGSYRGGLDHEQALQNVGYTVVKVLN